MTAQPKPWANIQDAETLQLLIDNIHCLEYPLPGRGTQWIKLPYFQHKFLPAEAQERVSETSRRFCEAIVYLLEKNDRLKKSRKTRRH